jgi:glutamate racemase
MTTTIKPRVSSRPASAARQHPRASNPRGELDSEEAGASLECTIDELDELPVAPHLGIGVFDSGSGGMVTASYVARMLEEADLPASTVFFGDTKHLPYGTRTEQQVAGFSDRIIRRLAPTCPVVGIACNTASAAWTHYGTVGKDADGPRVFSVVQVAAEEAYARARISSAVELAGGRPAKIIGVLGTHLTAQIQSHAERIVAMFRDEVSRIAGHELPLVPYAFGPAGPRPAVPADLIDFAKTPHIGVLREDETGSGGTTRAVAMHVSLPPTTPEAVVIVARDAQELVKAVDVDHVLDASGALKPKWRASIAAYLEQQVSLLVRRGATSLILGCTHFEYFERDFATVLPTMAARNAIISPSGALAVRLMDAWLELSSGRIRPIDVRRHACFGFSGEPPPLAMFRSLGLKHISRVASLADASS